MTNKLDQLYRYIRLGKYFTKGWGKPEDLKRICQFRKVVSNRQTCYNLISPEYPVIIDKEQEEKDCILIEGHFVSPLVKYLPEVVPKACHEAYFQIVLPKKWADDKFKPMVIQIGGTGDQFYWRRRQFIAKPLLKEGGIGSIILENPFYGLRKPKDQQRSILHNVSDVLVMGGCLTLESLVLFHYCERIGLGPLGITGLSMGGHMATIAATAWPKPLVIVPCLAGMTASYVFTQGVVSQALNWKLLREEYNSDRMLKDEVRSLLNNIDGEAFKAGQQFAKNFNNESCDNNGSFTVSFDTLSKNKVLTAAIKKSNNVEMLSDTTPKNRKTENNLLNLIVKYARASVNFNFISASASEVENMITENTVAADQNEQEVVNFMHGIMDECTHLKNFPIPVDTSLAIAVCAEDDAYIPVKARSNFQKVWPGSEVRYVKGGHVRAYIQNQRDFRSAIIDGFGRYRKKYEDNVNYEQNNNKNDSNSMAS